MSIFAPAVISTGARVRRSELHRFVAAASWGDVLLVHGANLSGSNNPLAAVEEDIVLLRRGMWDELVPADPALLAANWAAWGDLGDPPVPLEIQKRFWGEGAHGRWQAWLREKRRKAIGRQLRYIPRQIISTGPGSAPGWRGSESSNPRHRDQQNGYAPGEHRHPLLQRPAIHWRDGRRCSGADLFIPPAK